MCFIYLHLGQDTVTQTKDIIGIFDFESSTTSEYTRKYLTKAERENKVVSVSMEMPKSFVLCCDGAEQIMVYTSQISSTILLKRSRFMENLSNVQQNTGGWEKTGKKWRRPTRLQLLVCLHYGQKVSYVRAQFLRQEGEYRCPSRDGFSGVFLSTAVSISGSIVMVVSVVVFLVLRLVTGGLPFYGMLLVALPYALFFLAAPLLVRLREPGMRKWPPALPRSGTPPLYLPGNRSGQGPGKNHSFERF